jgi:hypothetical protein
MTKKDLDKLLLHLVIETTSTEALAFGGERATEEEVAELFEWAFCLVLVSLSDPSDAESVAETAMKNVKRRILKMSEEKRELLSKRADS